MFKHLPFVSSVFVYSSLLVLLASTDLSAQNATALNFDGSNDVVAGPTLNVAVTNRTLSAWVRLGNNTQQGGGLVSLQTIGGSTFDAIVYNETNQGWGFGSNGYARTVWSGVQEAASPQWVHIAATYANNDYRLYRNGVQIASTPSFGVLTYASGTSQILVGQRHTGGGGAWLNGDIDDVTVWNRVLTPTEIQALMTSSPTSGASGLLTHYKFDNGIVNANNAGLTSAADNSGNGRTGTLSNFLLNGATSNWTNGIAIFGNSSVCIGGTTDLSANGETDWTLPTGGTITTSGNDYIHTFSSGGTFATAQAIASAQVLVVAGGGGGGNRHAGGGGAGGYIFNSAFSIPSGSQSITVGNGGTGSTGAPTPGTNGFNSVFSTLTAFGGGGGSTNGNAANSGGSGGGGSNGSSGSAGTPGQGNAGGSHTPCCFPYGAGGGGAGAAAASVAGPQGSAGGVGLSNSISGSAVFYAGGGGGGADAASSYAGGNGGGGAGGNNISINGSNGTANTGGGGGGGGANGGASGNGGAGGSGVVIVRYTAPRWTSSNAAVATVNAQTGLVTAVSAGTVTITYTSAIGATASSVVTVNSNSVAPTGITGITSICPGASTVLTLSGGSAGTGATAQWFSGSCGGTSVGTGNNITVTPSASTSYFVRYAGTCNTTTCASVTVGFETTPPVLTCASNVTISNTLGLCTGTTTLTAPTVTDNCTTPGNALNFDGSDDFVGLPNLNLTTNTITFECWMRPNGSQIDAAGLIFRRDGGNASGLNIGYLDATRIGYHWNDDPSTYHWTGGPVYNANQWNHVALVIEPTRATIYLNGVPYVNNVANPAINLSGVIKIGFDLSNRYFNGAIDEVRIWNYARSQAQIVADMNNELNAASGLLASLNFNQGAAGGNNAGLTTAVDASGNNMTGTLNNMALTGATSNWVCSRSGCVTNNAPATYAVGNTTVTWTATDAAGNASTCTQTVRVNDTQAPVITCPTNITVNNTAGGCNAAVTFNATATDICSATTITYSPASGSSFSVGLTTVTATAVDAAGNSASCTFTVRVNDTQAPSITCAANVTQNAAAGLCNANVTVTAPTVTDNCQTQGNALNFDGTNDFITSSGNLTLSSSSISVEAWIKPVTFSNYSRVAEQNGTNNFYFGSTLGANGLSIWMNNTEQVTTAAGTIVPGQWQHVAFTFDQPTRALKIYINGVLQASVTTSVGVNGITGNVPLFIGKWASANSNYFNGTMDEVRVWNVARTQAGIQADMNREIAVNTSGLLAYYRFNQGIASGNNTTVTTVANLQGTAALNGTLSGFGLNGATSNFVDGAPALNGVTLTNSFNGTANASGTYPVGTTTVTWTATDAAGNASTCTQTVSVNDTQAPVITCPANITMSNAAGACSVSVTYAATATDNCGATTITYTPASGSSFSAGLSTVTATAVDAAGNSASCTFTVSVTPPATPTISVTGATTFCAGGSATLSAVSQNNALILNGSGQYANLGNNANLKPSTAFTLEAWIRPSNVSGQFDIFSSGRDAAGLNGYHFVVQNGALRLWMHNYSIDPVGGTLVANTWYHVAATYSTTNGARIYLNGNLVGTDNSLLSNVTYTSEPVMIGTLAGSPSFYQFNGAIDEARIWSVEKTQTDIQAAMSTTVPSNSAGLSGYYKFDETSGTTVNDATAAANNGTLVGSPTRMIPSTAPLTQPVLWSTGATTSSIVVNTSGTYTATVTNSAGCAVATSPVVITVNPNPTVTFSGSNTGCGSVSLTAGGGTTYAWSGGSTPSTAGNTFTTSGTYIVTVGNASGCSATASQTVTVNTLPVFTTCPTSFAVANTLNSCQAAVTYTAAASGSPVPAYTFATSGAGLISGFGTGSTSFFNVGTSIVSISATNSCGVATCTFNVTVNDTQAPSITCPTNITVSNTAGACNAAVTFAATATDNCGATTVTYSPASGSTFAAGLTTVTATAVDAAGNAASCTFTVRVNDTQAPVITCTSNVTISNTLGLCTGTTTLTGPTVTDNCTTTGNALNFDGVNDQIATASYTAGAVFTGNITMEASFRATTLNGNTILSRNYLNEFDLTLWSNRLQYYHGNGSTWVDLGFSYVFSANTWYHIAVVRNTAASSVSLYVNGVFQQTVNYGAPAPVAQTGSFYIGCRPAGTLFNGTIDEVRLWTVARTASEILANKDIEVAPQAGLYAVYRLNEGVANGNNTGVITAIDASGNARNGTLSNFTLSGTTSNWVAGAPTVATIAVANNAPATYPIGTTTVTWTATDAAGNASTCTQTVRVNDTQVPSITCPTNITVSNTVGACNAAVTFAATATDNCGATTVTYSPASGSTFNAGLTTVTATAVDAAGNSASCTFTVRVNDTEAPVITCAPSVTINNTPGLCSGTTTLVAPTVTDNCTVSGNALNFDGNSDRVSVPAFPSMSNVTLETWIRGNAFSGFNALLDQTWTSGAFHFQMASGAVGFSVNGNNPTDFVAGSVPTNTWTHIALVYEAGPRTAKLYINGTLIQTMNYTTAINIGAQSGNIGSWDNSRYFSGNIDNFRVWSVARTAGEIASNMNATLSTQAGLIANYTFNQGTAAGNNAGLTTAIDASGNGYNGTLNTFALTGATSNWVAGAPTVVSSILTNNAPATYPIGTTTVTWTATDAAGNASTCTQTVRVNDTQAPSITCPANITVSNTAGACTAAVTFAATATDNCGATTVTYSPASGSTFAAGLTTVTATAVDAAGNAASCTFTVRVNDTQAPVITCPANITVSNTAGACNAAVTFAATATDNCGATTVTYSPASGSTFAAGLTTVTATAVDAAGNAATCTFTVRVNDTQIPTLTCQNITVTLDAGGQATITPSQLVASLSDNCSPNTSITLAASQTSFNCSNISNSGGLSYSLALDGTNEGIISNANANVPIGNAARTVALWVNPATTNGNIGSIFTQGSNDCTGFMFGIGMNASGLTFWGGCNDRGSSLVMPLNTWSHVALTYDGAGNVTLFRNAATPQTFNVGTLNTQASRLFMGIESTNNSTGRAFFNGRLDEVQMFNRVLTQSEIAQVMAGANPAAANRVAYYPFNEGSGNTTADLAQGNTATLQNMEAADWTTNSLAAGTAVTITATDAAGNAATCTAAVIVRDNIAPSITCPANITVSNAVGTCSAVTTFAATATDNCGVTTVTYSHASGSLFNIGLTTVSVSATDASGNQSTCSFVVRVNDVDAPLVSVPANITRCGAQAIAFTGVQAATVTDACGAVTVTYTPASGSTFAVGTTTVTVTGTDVFGNTATGTFTVTINAFPGAGITGVATACEAVSLTATGGTSYAWSGGATPLTAANTFTASGTYVVTVTDANTCSATASQVVTVNVANAITVSGTNPACVSTTLTASGAQSYVWSTGSLNASQDFTVGGNTSYTVTGTDGNGCTAVATGVANIRSGASNAALATGTVNGVSLQESCTENGWTYYVDPANQNQYIFAIEWGTGNDVAKNAAQVSIDVTSGLYGVTAAAGAGSNFPTGTWVMPRSWNVNTFGNALNNPVRVRFYHDPAEVAAANAAAAAFVSNHGLSTQFIEPFTWFKTVGTTYTPGNNITANGVYVGQSIPLNATYGVENQITYAQFDNVTSFSGGSGASGVGRGNPLPLTLEYFMGERYGDKSNLSWLTQTETNTSHFVVQRSLNGSDFSDIGQVQAAGNSNSPRDYAFVDEQPAPGNNYYRLRLVDLDGSFTFSNVIVLNFEKPFDVSAYPNPFSSTFTVDVYMQEEADSKIEVFDMSGRLLDVQSIYLTAGTTRSTIDGSRWTPGAYLVKVTAGGFTTHRTIVKTKF